MYRVWLLDDVENRVGKLRLERLEHLGGGVSRSSSRPRGHTGREAKVNQQRRLGRGLEALLGRPFARAEAQEPELVAEGQAAAQQVAVTLIDSNPYQPRQEFDPEEIAQLAESIRQHGILQPLLVRRQGERYQIIAGERRLRAAVQAGWQEVPVIVRDISDREMAELAIVENLQRKDLNPLEKATAFQQYLNQYQCTQEELARRLGIHRSTVANLLRLLELPESVQQMLRQGQISMGHARALLPLGEEDQQRQVAQQVVKEGLSVRAVESLVQEMLRRQDEEPLLVVVDQPDPTPEQDARRDHLASLEQQFKLALGTRVQIQQKGSGRGKIVIHFASHEEFQRLQALLCHGKAAPAVERSA